MAKNAANKFLWIYCPESRVEKQAVGIILFYLFMFCIYFQQAVELMHKMIPRCHQIDGIIIHVDARENKGFSRCIGVMIITRRKLGHLVWIYLFSHLSSFCKLEVCIMLWTMFKIYGNKKKKKTRIPWLHNVHSSLSHPHFPISPFFRTCLKSFCHLFLHFTFYINYFSLILRSMSPVCFCITRWNQTNYQ